MITITTEEHILYINTDLLRSRFKSAVITILKVLTFLCAFIGVIWILGTAVASDNDIITFSQIIIRTLQGFLCCGVAWVLNFIKLVIE